MTTFDFELNDWEARFLLEACRTLHQQWFKAAHATTDEDEQADYSNDLGQLEIFQRRRCTFTSCFLGSTTQVSMPGPHR